MNNDFPVGMRADKIFERKEFDKEVGCMLNKFLSISPKERHLEIAKEIRRMQHLDTIEFGDSMEILRTVIKRGNMLVDLHNAQQLLVNENLRRKYSR